MYCTFSKKAVLSELKLVPTLEADTSWPKQQKSN